jgi:hypothetical protein
VPAAASLLTEEPAQERRVDGPDQPTVVEEISAEGLSVATISTHVPRRISTRSQHGILKTMIYTDGTIRYNFFSTTREPSSLEEALSSRHWKEAMDSEFKALKGNNTWHVVPPKKG